MPLSTVTVTGELHHPDGSLAKDEPVTIIKVVKAGSLITLLPKTVRSHATTGVITLTLPASSTAYLYAQVNGLNANGREGVALAVPSSNANLEDLVSVSVIPSAGLTVKSNGVALASLIGTLNITGDGAVITQTAPGVAELEFTAGEGGGAPTGATYITQTPHAGLSAEQALSLLGTGLVKNTTGTGVLSIAGASDLPSGIDAAKLADGSVSNAEFQRLNGVTGDIQPALDAKLTQAAADLLYSAINHNHSGVYEPANANIQSHISSTSNPHSVTKTQVGLGSVSNDAQLKIASNLSDLNNAGTARTNLGVAIGSNVQAWDADLDALAALSSTGFVKRTGAATFTAANLLAGDIPDLSGTYEVLDANITRLGSSIDLSGAEATGTLADARFPATLPAISGVNLTGVLKVASNLSDLNNAATARSNLGVAIGSQVQAFNQNLADIAALADPNADRLLFWDDSAGVWKHLTLGTNLSITDTTLNASGGGSGASTALDNLASVAINTSLWPASDNAINLGSTAKQWQSGFFGTNVRIGSMYLQPSQTTGSTMVVIAGDFNTFRSMMAFSFRMGADDSGAADLALGRIDAGVATFTNPSGGNGILELGQVASGGTPSANSARIYVKDVAGNAEVFVKDEAGAETQISPHDPLTGEWIFYSSNRKTGKCMRVNMDRAMRLLEQISGEQFIEEWEEAA